MRAVLPQRNAEQRAPTSRIVTGAAAHLWLHVLHDCRHVPADMVNYARKRSAEIRTADFLKLSVGGCQETH